MTRTDDYPADIRTAGTVEVGGFATGEIETRGDVDWFKVELLAGVEYEIIVLGADFIAGALSDPYLVGIHDSSGNLIANTSNNDFFSRSSSATGIHFEPTAGGIHYIAMRSADGGTGTYRVDVSRRMGDDYAGDTGTTGTVAVGGFATGRIEATDDRDWFAVELLAGVEYRIDLRGSHTFAGTLADPYLVGVWHGATELEGSRDDDGGEGLDSRLSNFRPAADGTYYIAVSSSIGFTGTYRLSVTATSVFGVVKHTATDIAVGGSATGDIEQSGERDWFKIQLLAGVEYQIDIEGANFWETDTTDGTLRDPYLQGIYKPNGTKIPGTEKNDGGGVDNPGFPYNTRFVFEPEVNGTYYIATAGNAHYTGTYRLTVATVRSDDDDYSANTDDYPADIRTAGTVEVGGFATGEIETRRDVDWFKVTLEADTTYEFDVLASAVIAGALHDPYLVGIHDSSGNLIENTTNNDYGGGTNSRVLFDASTGGIYYIAVRSADGGTGTYRVDVSRRMDDDYAGDDSTTGTVAVGGFATGRIEADGDEDWFAVELMAGVDYRFDIRGSHTLAGTLPDPLLVAVWHDLRVGGVSYGTTGYSPASMTTTAARDLTAASQISSRRSTAPTTSPSAVQTPLPARTRSRSKRSCERRPGGGHGRAGQGRGVGRAGDPIGAGRERAVVPGGRAVQRLREPADADRPGLHASGLRPGAEFAVGGDAGGADRHRGLPVPGDGAAGSFQGAGAGARRGAVPGTDGPAGSGGDPHTRRWLARGPFGAGDGACRPRGDAALCVGSRSLRILRRALDADL